MKEKTSANHGQAAPIHLAHFLTNKYAKEYNQRWYGIRWLWIETTGNEITLAMQIESDSSRYEKFRRKLAAVLSRKGDTSKVADDWIFLLKARIERLDLWASVCGTFSAAYIALLAIYGLCWRTARADNYLSFVDLIAGVGLAVSLACAMLKFGVDRKKLWYKYVLSHLEAVSKKARAE